MDLQSAQLPEVDSMPGQRNRLSGPVIAAVSLAAGLSLPGTEAAAQDAAHFTPTYAASKGSPYSEVYARTFGAGGPPVNTPEPPAPKPLAQPLAQPLGPPLVTAAPPPKPAPPQAGAAQDEVVQDEVVQDEVVYVIEDGRLLTFSAKDYAEGGDRALATAPLPASPLPEGEAFGSPDAPLPSIADRLYGPAPLETAAGPQGAPIRLVPPN